jgi:hypothetical protein
LEYQFLVGGLKYTLTSVLDLRFDRLNGYPYIVAMLPMQIACTSASCFRSRLRGRQSDRPADAQLAYLIATARR